LGLNHYFMNLLYVACFLQNYFDFLMMNPLFLARCQLVENLYQFDLFILDPTS